MSRVLGTMCIIGLFSVHALVMPPRQMIKPRSTTPIGLLHRAPPRRAPPPLQALDAELISTAAASVSSESLLAWDPTGLAKYSWWAIIAVLFGAQAKVS